MCCFACNATDCCENFVDCVKDCCRSCCAKKSRPIQPYVAPPPPVQLVQPTPIQPVAPAKPVTHKPIVQPPPPSTSVTAPTGADLTSQISYPPKNWQSGTFSSFSGTATNGPCNFTRTELQDLLKQSQFGANEAMFDAYFTKNGHQVVCASCSKPIGRHAVDAKSRPGRPQQQNDSINTYMV